jgi:hypothetical protein
MLLSVVLVDKVPEIFLSDVGKHGSFEFDYYSLLP